MSAHTVAPTPVWQRYRMKQASTAPAARAPLWLEMTLRNTPPSPIAMNARRKSNTATAIRARVLVT